MDCHNICLTCHGPEYDECSSCTGGKYIHSGSCVTTFPDNYYDEGTLCRICALNCKRCYTSSLCKECSVGYFLHAGGCVLNCPWEGFYHNNSASSGSICDCCHHGTLFLV